jgi:nitroreductase
VTRTQQQEIHAESGQADLVNTATEPVLDCGRAETLADAAFSRRSVRGFLDRPVPAELLEQVLTVAATAPSGSNTQPWRVFVLTGSRLAALGGALQAAYLGDEPRRPEYEHYASPLPELYYGRRRECGWGLYGTLGIARGERDRSKAYRATNYNFFSAPVGMVFTIHRQLNLGSWLDYGMFLQTAMLAARSVGLHTCVEGSIAEYPDIVRLHLSPGADELILCGMALGYADPAAPINAYQPRRCAVTDFATFVAD